MSLGHSPSTVTNGLVLLLDAANRTSFPLTENLYTYSEDYNGATWGRPNATVSSDSALAPDGTLTADKVIPNAGLTDGSIWNYSPTIPALTQYTMSYYLKAAGWNYAFVWIDNGAGNGFTVEVNLATGAARATRSINNVYFTGLSFTNTYVSNGWFRVTMTFTTGSGAATNSQTRIYPSPTAWVSGNFGTVSATGDGVNGIYVWGAQFNQGAVATDYYKTTGSTYPRASVWYDRSLSRSAAVLQNGAYYSPTTNAMVFNGTSAVANVPAPVGGLPTGNGARTVSIWFYTQSGTWTNNIYNLLFYGSNAVTRQAFAIDFSTYPNMEVWTQADDLTFAVTGAQVGWHHVLVTYNGNLTLTVYYNGVQAATKTLGAQLATASNTALNIGSWGTTYFFLGQIAQVAVHNVALSATEAAQTFQSLRGRFGL